MSPEIAEAIGPFLAMIGLGTMILIGMKLRYNHIQRTRFGHGADQERERLREDVDAVRDEVRALRDDFAELYERVDFAERLLTRGKAPDADVDALPEPRD